MDLEDFLHRVEDLAPRHGLGLDDPLALLRPYQRLVLVRWWSSCLERPTDHSIVRQFATLGDAWRWLQGALASGERLRAPVAPTANDATNRVRLRPLLDQDLLPLYLTSLDPRTAASWRFRGRTVPIDEFVAGIADGVRVQFTVELVSSGDAVGLVVAYDHHQAGLHAKVGFVRFGERHHGDEGALLEGFALFVSHLFLTFPYRKLYIELPAYNLGLLEPAIFEVEGVLRDYLFHDGEPVDLHLGSISRARWEAVRASAGW